MANITAKQDGGTLHIYMSGAFSYWEVASDVFNELIAGADGVTHIRAYINSIGGSFYEGLAIYNALRQHGAHITTINNGYALSMGSVVLLAGDDIRACATSLTMIHRAAGLAWGDAEAMRHEAKVLEKHEDIISERYQARLGVDAKAVAKLLNAETWYTGKEAVEAGLVDALSDEDNASESNEDSAISDDINNMSLRGQMMLAATISNAPDDIKAQFNSVGLNADADVRSLTSLKPSPTNHKNKGVFGFFNKNNNESDDMTPEQATKLEQIHAQLLQDDSAKEQRINELQDELASIAETHAAAQSAAVASATEEAATNIEALTKKNEALSAEVQTLKTKVEELQKPGGDDFIPDNTGDGLSEQGFY